METIKYTVAPKENFYFGLKVIFGLIGYVLLYMLIDSIVSSDKFMSLLPLLIYIPLIMIFLFFRLGILIGYLQGNSIKVTRNQFPDLNNIVLRQCEQLGMNKVPDVYILQEGGFLNAFAIRFLGNNYIVLFSDILDEAYENSTESIEFIIGHELGHIKRNHMLKSLLLFPSIFVPFLNSAYSRACEYTCDSIGANLNSDGAQPGLLILASGKRVWKKVSANEFMQQETTENGFWSWFAEKVSSHPKLTKRLIRLKKMDIVNVTIPKPEPVKPKEVVTDHSQYMPKL